MFPDLGPLDLYDFFTVVGFLAGAAYMFRALSAEPGVSRRRLLLAIAGAYLASQYGGAVIPWLWRLIRSDPAPDFLGSGRYFHSAFLAVLVYVILGLKWLRIPIRKGLDHYAIAATLMSAIGRLGCFATGCCAGKPTRLIWGLAFPDKPDLPVHPTQLYMFGVETLLAWILLKMNRSKRYDGQVFWSGVWLYCLYRLWIETLRTNPIFLWNLTHAQAFSMLTLLLSSGVLLFYRKHPPLSGATTDADRP